MKKLVERDSRHDLDQSTQDIVGQTIAERGAWLVQQRQVSQRGHELFNRSVVLGQPVRDPGGTVELSQHPQFRIAAKVAEKPVANTRRVGKQMSDSDRPLRGDATKRRR